jgi:hypothetical protein
VATKPSQVREGPNIDINEIVRDQAQITDLAQAA